MLSLQLGQIVDGKTLGDHWQHYTVNVKKLGTMTHEQWCTEYPNAAREIERLNIQIERLEKLMASQPEAEEVK